MPQWDTPEGFVVADGRVVGGQFMPLRDLISRIESGPIMTAYDYGIQNQYLRFEPDTTRVSICNHCGEVMNNHQCDNEICTRSRNPFFYNPVGLRSDNLGIQTISGIPDYGSLETRIMSSLWTDVH